MSQDEREAMLLLARVQHASIVGAQLQTGAAMRNRMRFCLETLAGQSDRNSPPIPPRIRRASARECSREKRPSARCIRGNGNDRSTHVSASGGTLEPQKLLAANNSTQLNLALRAPAIQHGLAHVGFELRNRSTALGPGDPRCSRQRHGPVALGIKRPAGV